VKKVTGDVDNKSTAVAYSSCTDCRTVAVAVQVVLVSGDPDEVGPQNVSLTLNYDCAECESLAAAYQVVFGNGDEKWLDDPEVSDGPSSTGGHRAGDREAGPDRHPQRPQRLSGQFEAGDGLQPLEGDAADRVRRAATETTAEVVTGKEDRLLRRADASITLAVTDPEVREALGELSGARLRLGLDVSEINRPVQVADPTAR